MSRYKIGREDFLKGKAAELLLGRRPDNSPRVDEEIEVCERHIAAVRAGHPVDAILAELTPNQDAMWMLIACWLNLPGAWRMFARLAELEAGGQTGFKERTSPYGNWRLAAWIGCAIAARAQGRRQAYRVARELARRHATLFALGSYPGDGSQTTYALAGPRWHPGNPQGIAAVVASLTGGKMPKFGSNFREHQYGKALCLIALEAMGAGELFDGEERKSLADWVAGKRMTAVLEALLSGVNLAGRVEIYASADNRADTVCPEIPPCDDPLAGSVMIPGQGPRELRWETINDTGPRVEQADLGYNPLWTDGVTRCEYDGRTLRAEFSGRTLLEDSHRSVAEIKGHGAKVVTTIVLEPRGVTLNGRELRLNRVETDGIETEDQGGGSVPSKPGGGGKPADKPQGGEKEPWAVAEEIYTNLGKAIEGRSVVQALRAIGRLATALAEIER